MSDLDKILKDYKDFELAFLVKYKLTNYSDSTLEKIYGEIKLRNLNSSDLEKLISEKLKIDIKNHDFKICPRCTSDKILSSREDYFGDRALFDKTPENEPKYIDHKICAVCGWDFAKNETKFDKRKRNKRVVLSLIISIIVSLILSIMFNWI